MSRRDRTTRTDAPAAHRGDGWKVVFVPGQIELDLVGVIEGDEALAGAEAIEGFVLDPGEDLLALVERLGAGALAVGPDLRVSFASPSAAGTRPLH